jgi:Cof subfamily protein (haloacid dehalogenase superfamily)
MIRLIAFDLDGTVLKGAETMSGEVRASLLEARRFGVKLAVATGRSVSQIPACVKGLPPDFLITLNGARVVDCATGGEITKIPMKPGDVGRIEILARDGSLGIHAFPLEGHIIFERRCLKVLLLNYSKNMGMPRSGLINALKFILPTLIRDARIVRRIDPAGKYLKMEMYYPDQYSCRLAMEKFSRISGVAAAFGSPVTIEITDVAATKGFGLEKVCAACGISKEETFAIGDSGNDVSLRGFAGTFVAMGNAVQELKNLADYITDAVSNDGAAKAIKKFVLEEG